MKFDGPLCRLLIDDGLLNHPRRRSTFDAIRRWEDLEIGARHDVIDDLADAVRDVRVRLTISVNYPWVSVAEELKSFNLKPPRDVRRAKRRRPLIDPTIAPESVAELDDDQRAALIALALIDDPALRRRLVSCQTCGAFFFDRDRTTRGRGRCPAGHWSCDECNGSVSNLCRYCPRCYWWCDECAKLVGKRRRGRRRGRCPGCDRWWCDECATPVRQRRCPGCDRWWCDKCGKPVSNRHRSYPGCAAARPDDDHE